jgi:hypothetical protein
MSVASLMMRSMYSQTTRRRIPEDDTIHNHRCENLKSYKTVTVCRDVFVIFCTLQKPVCYFKPYLVLFVNLFMSLQGEDSVVECVHDGTGGNNVNAYMSWNSGKDNKRLKVRNRQILYVRFCNTHTNGSSHVTMVTVR